MRNKGYTLTELIVVITVIVVLATTGFIAYDNAIKQAKISKAKADTANIAAAIKLLQYDTNKSYGGCPAGKYMCYPEFPVRDTLEEGALATVPTAYYDHTTIDYRCTLDWTDVYYDQVPSSQYAYCDWTAPDIAKWQGPYMTNLSTDPWGRRYWVDYSYFGYSGIPGDPLYPGCGSFPDRCGNNCANMHDGIAIVSSGPDRLWYTCDDVQYYLYQLPSP